MSAIAKHEVRPSLHHVTMKTSHLDEMIKWYALVLGTEVQFRNETAAWTTNDEANHRIAFLAVRLAFGRCRQSSAQWDAPLRIRIQQLC